MYQNASKMTPAGTQQRTFMAMIDKFRHIALTVLVGCLSCAAAAHPLEDAAHEAMALCARVDGVETIDQCMSTTSQSEHRPPARAALQRLFKARTAFMRECDTGGGLVRCQEQSDLYIWAGISRGFSWTVVRMDRPLPPPAQRR
jgi:hypothetical protein